MVRLPAAPPPLAPSIDLDGLLPPSGTCFIEVKDDFDGPLIAFGKAFKTRIVPAVRNLVPNAGLTSIR
ncbi:hypothetical protein Q0L96_13655, partial [Staphylococcus aureus]|nr:hypothetical protein [Staphylococcus aureus]